MTGCKRPISEEAWHLAEGEAAFVLIQSLLLTLVEKGILSREDMTLTLENAVEVERRLAEGAADTKLSEIAAGLLVKVSNSHAAAGALRRSAAE